MTHSLRADTPPPNVLVSVVIPCYNQAHFLGEAIESALQQSYEPIEVVVVDDGSPDDTAAVASRYPAVRYVRRANGGLPAARNTGVAQSTGELVVFLDSDDVLLPDAVAAGVQVLAAHPDCGFAAGWCQKITATGERLPLDVPDPPHEDAVLRLLRNNGGVLPLACMYRRAAVLEVGGYDESFRSLEDWDLNLRVGRKFGACFHPTVVGLYRQHAASMSRNAERMLVAFATLRRRERWLVQAEATHAAALNHADRWMRAYFGEAIVERARTHWRGRDWSAVTRDVGSLLRYYPAGLVNVLRFGLWGRFGRLWRSSAHETTSS